MRPNAWGIPEWLEREIRARDKVCVYCGVAMLEKVPQGQSRKSAATWEHIINDARIVTLANIARCCAACNSSKGQKLLEAWLSSPYCAKRGITKETVAAVVRQALHQAIGAQQGAAADGPRLASLGSARR